MPGPIDSLFEGFILYDPQDSSPIYWIDNGLKRHIVNEATYQGVFGGPDKSPKQQYDLAAVTSGDDVLAGSAIVKPLGGDKEYLVVSGVVRYISSEEAKAKYRLNGNVHSVPVGLVEKAPQGTDLE
jgi:hypothetical protein